MTVIRLSLLLSAALLGCVEGLHSYQSDVNLRLSALFFQPPKPNAPLSLWLRVENLSKEPRVLCRSYWSYAIRAADPNGPATSESNASLHGCGDRDHDPYWLLLPGESRFDSVELPAAADVAGFLEVELRLVEFDFSLRQLTTQIISWRGRLADAAAAGERLKGKQPR